MAIDMGNEEVLRFGGVAAYMCVELMPPVFDASGNPDYHIASVIRLCFVGNSSVSHPFGSLPCGVNAAVHAGHRLQSAGYAGEEWRQSGGMIDLHVRCEVLVRPMPQETNYRG
jgi:hypothetical protein